MIGRTLGPYQVVEKLGEGGMGEVFRARDSRLQRDVAIKVLPAAFASDPDRVARLAREAQVLASLNHQHIAQIYGLEESGESRALIMELVEGETLADVLARGPIDVDEALSIARQIAEALEVAHDAGIVHRDLKPGNIKLRPDGTVKVLDFGLATYAANPGTRGASASADSPTFTSPAVTQAGVILGTAAYMSPEQARGKVVDRRADVWAFGCVLYEMITGRVAFGGETVSDVIGNVLRADPDWTRLPATTPESVRTLLRRCLEKDVRERLPHIGVARLDLTRRDSESSPAKRQRPSAAALLTVAAVGMIVGGALTMAALRVRRDETPSLGPVHMVLLPPAGTVRFGQNTVGLGVGAASQNFALSRDGRKLAFTAVDSDNSVSLWVRTLASADAEKLPGTANAAFPFWSPDGEQLAFFSDGQLRRVVLNGGAASIVCPASAPEGGSWSTDGTIVFTPDFRKGIWRVAATGGSPTQVTIPETAATHRWPQFVDNDSFVYFVQAQGPRASARLHSLASGRDIEVLETTTPVAFANGHLLFVRDGQLVARPFDASTGTLRDQPRPLVADVAVNPTTGRSAFAVSQAGSLVFRSNRAPRGDRLLWVSRDGVELQQLGEEGRRDHGRVALSPDQARAAVQIIDSERTPVTGDLWTYDLDRGTRSKLTTESGFEWAPVWSSDGRIAYSVAKSRGDSGGSTLWMKSAGGTEPGRKVESDQAVTNATDWTTDGSHLVVETSARETGKDIWLAPVNGGPLKPLIRTAFNEGEARFSPDGRWIAYSSEESGQSEVYVQGFPSLGNRLVVSSGGGSAPQWRGDGREIYFQREADLYAADFSPDGPRLGVPHRLFADLLLPGLQRYAPSRDGQRFLAIAPRANDRARDPRMTLHLILDWPQLLSQQ